MNHDQFRQVRRLQRLRDRNGRVWTVYAEPFEDEGVTKMIVRAGDLVRRVPEDSADNYMLLEDDDGSGPDSPSGHTPSPEVLPATRHRGGTLGPVSKPARRPRGHAPRPHF